MARSGLKSFENFFEKFIFWSRWVQAPMYGGLIIASFIYVYKFFEELSHLVTDYSGLEEKHILLGVLGLVDITMVINLLVMVTIGGYSIFTSHIDVDHHEDKPLWLEGLDAGKLKIKLATSLASISGVHLLKTFMAVKDSLGDEGTTGVVIEIGIHLTFIISALLLAFVEKVQHSYHNPDPLEAEEQKKDSNDTEEEKFLS